MLWSLATNTALLMRCTLLLVWSQKACLSCSGFIRWLEVLRAHLAAYEGIRPVRHPAESRVGCSRNAFRVQENGHVPQLRPLVLLMVSA